MLIFAKIPVRSHRHSHAASRFSLPAKFVPAARVLLLIATGAILATASAIPAAVAGQAEASASPSPPSHTIAGARAIVFKAQQAGGGAAVDFWRIKLVGGDQVQFAVNYPVNHTYEFDLYAPSTTDTTFPQATPLTQALTNSGTDRGVLTIQAPYTGNFILAVCENPIQDCTDSAFGNTTHPENPYTFTPTLVGGGITGTKASGEVKASATIARSPALPIGHFEAGGGNGADFWRIKLVGGDQVRFAVNYPVNHTYEFDLYAPRTTDTTFPQATPLTQALTNSGTDVGFFTIQAPFTGNFILAVCENPIQDCTDSAFGNTTHPENPYTFTPRFLRGPGVTVTLKLSTSRVAYGNEKSLKASVVVSTKLYGHLYGRVTIRAGRKRICTVRISSTGKGTCSPSSQTLLAVGTHWVRAAYTGTASFPPATSKATKLIITKRK